MGFWGAYVAAKAVPPLTQQPSVAALGGQVDWHNRHDGWQVLRIHQADLGAAAALADDLAAAVDGPVLVALVADSDFAEVTGATPDGASWTAVLNRDAAASYGLEEGVDFPALDDLAGSLAAATSWAAAGRAQANPARVRAVLTEGLAQQITSPVGGTGAARTATVGVGLWAARARNPAGSTRA